MRLRTTKSNNEAYGLLPVEDFVGLLTHRLRLRVSYTRLSVYEDCPKKYHFTYILSDREPPSEAMLLGSAVHSALETWMAEQGEDEDELLDIFSAAVARYRTEGEISGEEEETARHMLLDYYSQVDMPRERETVIAVEQPFSIIIGGLEVIGFIDRLNLSTVGEGSDSCTVLNIIDYKSGRSSITQAKAKTNRQLAIYTLAAREMYPGMNHYSSHFVYPRLNKTISYTFSTEELNNHIREIKKIGKDIRADNSFRPKGSPMQCAYCGHVRKCGYGKIQAKKWIGILRKRGTEIPEHLAFL